MFWRLGYPGCRYAYPGLFYVTPSGDGREKTFGAGGVEAKSPSLS